MPYRPCKCGHGKSSHSTRVGVKPCGSSCDCKGFEDATPEERRQIQVAKSSRNKTKRPNYYRDAQRRSRLCQQGQELESLFVGLPEIDFDLATQLMDEDISHVPEGWPQNWQHLVLLRHIREDMAETETNRAEAQDRLNRLATLARQVISWFTAGDKYFGVKQRNETIKTTT